MVANGWYADPSGRHVQRLFLAGTWTFRVRGSDGREVSDAPAPQPVPAERRPAALATVGAAAACIVIGLVALRWDAGSFAHLRSGKQHSPLTRAYAGYLAYPLAAGCVLATAAAALDRHRVRLVAAFVAALGGTVLLAAGHGVYLRTISHVFSQVQATHGSVRPDLTFGPALTLLSSGSVMCKGLAVGAYLEKRGLLARAAIGALCLVAAGLSVATALDAPGAAGWVVAVGFGLAGASLVL